MRHGSNFARQRIWFRLTGWLALMILCGQPLQVLAQPAGSDPDRSLQPGDEIIIAVSGRSDLSKNFTLDASGAVTIDQVGTVSLAGLTIPEAQQVLRQRLRLFYPTIDAVEVTLRSGSGFTIYVIGEVTLPGEYDFMAAPNLFELMRAAGGPSETANLRGARIVRAAAGETATIAVDLTGVMEGVGSDVELRNGDTLVIPAAAEGVPVVSSSAGIQVFGSVLTPTVVPANGPMELMDVLMQAGSPSTTAKLSGVWWVHRTEGGSVATKVNVQRYMQEGDPAGNPIIYPGDTVQVEETIEPWIVRRLPLFLGMIATTATVMLAYDRLRD